MDFEKQIQTDRESLIQDIMKLVSIDSVETAPDAGMPFGAGAAKALDCFLETAESIGLKTENFDHYAGHADYGDQEETLGILGHVDVVPCSGSWVCDPFKPEIIDGKLYTGCNSLAGELGHIVIRQGGEPCGCGRRGCLEAYSSAAALVKFAHRALDAGWESSLRENGSNLNAKHICDAVDAGDALACELFETYCDDLACGLSSFINIFQPECIVLGGGLAGYGEKLLTPLRRRIEKETFRGDTNTELVLASLGNDAGLVGAAML